MKFSSQVDFGDETYARNAFKHSIRSKTGVEIFFVIVFNPL